MVVYGWQAATSPWGQNRGDLFTAEIAEGAEMKGTQPRHDNTSANFWAGVPVLIWPFYHEVGQRGGPIVFPGLKTGLGACGPRPEGRVGPDVF